MWKTHGFGRWYQAWYGENEPLVGARGDVLPSTVLLRDSSAVSGCLLEDAINGMDLH